uniref:Nucleolin-like isoform X1 n=1 Tax=Crassostrea virginica TaxID=6565 RepID=A0A8B8EZI2_CRAVI|nr:nucleolin-like isoform X1 [Crassostrea virginica]
MEEFVRKLVKKSDLSLLTKGKIKEAYRNKIGRDITPEEKNALSQALKHILTDINAHGGNKENAQSLASPLKEVISPKKLTPIKKKEKASKSSNQKKTRTSLSPRLRVDEVVDAVMKSSDEEEKEEVEEEDTERISPKKKKSPIKRQTPEKKKRVNAKKRSIDKIEDVVSAVLDSGNEDNEDNEKFDEEDEENGDSESDEKSEKEEAAGELSGSESEYEPFKDESD